MFESIGPVWDGNEVWLVVAGGATFAAFPAWYATMFSRLLPRAAADPRPADRPRGLVRVAREARRPALAATWLWANTIGSVGAAFIWGVALANLVHGVPLDSDARLHRRLPRPLQPLHRARRTRRGAAVRAPRRDVPDAPHDAATSASGRPRRRGGCRVPAAVARRRLPRLDGRRRPRPQRRGHLPAAVPRRSRSRRSSSPRVFSARPRGGWAFAATASAHRASSRRSSPACIRACSSRPRLRATA